MTREPGDRDALSIIGKEIETVGTVAAYHYWRICMWALVVSAGLLGIGFVHAVGQTFHEWLHGPAKTALGDG